MAWHFAWCSLSMAFVAHELSATKVEMEGWERSKLSSTFILHAVNLHRSISCWFVCVNMNYAVMELMLLTPLRPNSWQFSFFLRLERRGRGFDEFSDLSPHVIEVTRILIRISIRTYELSEWKSRRLRKTFRAIQSLIPMKMSLWTQWRTNSNNEWTRKLRGEKAEVHVCRRQVT